MSFDPYLHFQGTCAEAMELYRDWFGGTLTVMRYADAPPGAAPVPEGAAGDLVMHAALELDGRVLMASDFPPGWGEAQKAVTISHAVTDPTAAETLFARMLAEGGEVIMPFAATFFSPGFGMLRDRFGTHWMILVPQAG
ncbi:VOC family protein [Frigidibacter sp. MR17.14]|uniref:VOC family protein n=1 Tax=Frigidibacter sp. MR17.14 TaxID=3126509 RepID=UPI00301301CC